MKFPCVTAGVIPVYLASSVLAGTKEVWWDITYVENANPDGLFQRRVIGVNNTWPCVILSQLLRKLNSYYLDHLRSRLSRPINWCFMSRILWINQLPSITMECFLIELRGWTVRDRCLNGDYFQHINVTENV